MRHGSLRAKRILHPRLPRPRTSAEALFFFFVFFFPPRTLVRRGLIYLSVTSGVLTLAIVLFTQS